MPQHARQGPPVTCREDQEPPDGGLEATATGGGAGPAGAPRGGVGAPQVVVEPVEQVLRDQLMLILL